MKNKGFGFAVMSEHVQKELLKLYGIEFHGNIIIIEEATSTRIKRPDEQNTGLLRSRLNEPSFPSAQFAMENYEIRGKRGIICKRVKQFETVISESVCSEITISKKKCFCMGIYRPPNFNNLDTFFKEVSDSLSLSKASLAYENFIIMGDFNIDINTAGIYVDKLEEFCNLFNLTTLIKTETCCTKNQKSTIDLFLTNIYLSFQKTRTAETGINDYHELISTFLKSHDTLLKSKIIYCRNYKNFNEELLLKDLENSNLSANSDNPH